MKVVDTAITFIYGLLILSSVLWLASCQLHAQALDLKPYAALIIGQGLDIATTLRPTPSCLETNPRFGAQPSAMRVLMPKLALVGGIALLVRFTETRESHAARIVAKSAAYLSGAIGAKDGIHNLRTCGW